MKLISLLTRANEEDVVKIVVDKVIAMHEKCEEGESVFFDRVIDNRFWLVWRIIIRKRFKDGRYQACFTLFSTLSEKRAEVIVNELRSVLSYRLIEKGRHERLEAKRLERTVS